MSGLTRWKRLEGLDRLLIVAIVVLACHLLLQFGELGRSCWQHWPRSGRQVQQQFVGKVGKGTNARQVGANYLLYLPAEFDKTRSWPLVVFLHGAGQRGEDLEQVRRAGLPKRVEEGEAFGFILASPQCPAEGGWDPETVVALVDHLLTSWPIDRNRVYLTGFSLGGYGTWQTAGWAPDRFAAIAPLAGWQASCPAEQLAQLPIWVFHGDEDEVVPLAESERTVEAVRQCGGEVQFTVYPQCNHGGCCERTYRDPQFFQWLLAQRRQAEAR